MNMNPPNESPANTYDGRRFRYTMEELNSLIFAEQGFVVIGSLCPLKVGKITGQYDPMEHCTRPVRVTGPSCYREYHDQCVRACFLDTGKQLERVDRFPYYFRTEAPD